MPFLFAMILIYRVVVISISVFTGDLQIYSEERNLHLSVIPAKILKETFRNFSVTQQPYEGSSPMNFQKALFQVLHF